MTMTRKPCASPYLTWAKAHHGVTFNLASSGVRPPLVDALGPTSDDWSLTTEHEDGWMPLIERIAARYEVPSSSVALAQGCSMANHLVCALLLEPGDHVVVEHPAYEPLHLLPRFFHADVSFFERSGELGLDPARVEAELTARTRLVSISNLHNPTGRLATRESLTELATLAESRGFHVLVDEVYLEWLRHVGETTALSLSPRFITTRSLTKAYGLDAIRAGWILADAPVAERLRRLMDLYAVKMAHASERLAARALDRAEALLEPGRRRLTENQGRVQAFIDAHAGLAWNPPHAGSVGLVEVEGFLVDDLVTALERRDTLVAPGRFFGVPDAFRIGFGMDPDTLGEGLSRLDDAIEDVYR